MLRLMQMAAFVTSYSLAMYSQVTTNYMVGGFFGLIAALAATRAWMAFRYRARLVHGPGKGEFRFEFPGQTRPPPRDDVLPPESPPPRPELPTTAQKRDWS
jgi:hypothetical protein